MSALQIPEHVFVRACLQHGFMRLNLRERVKLLAASYPEVCEAGRAELDTNMAAVFESRPPKRGESWEDGSYWEFECATEDLRLQSRLRYRWFWRVYVLRIEKLEKLAPHKKQAAEQGLTFVADATRRRGKGNVYVPDEISLNARNYGWKEDFPEVEAKSARRPRERLAA